MERLLLSLRGIGKFYGKHEALRDINLEIERGEILSLLGVNGAGKTTLSSIIATLHPPTQGDILYEGQSIYTNIAYFRSHIGYCPQRPNLNEKLTLWENLFFAGRFYRIPTQEIEKRIGELAERFELTRYLPERASMLSGGYQQRFMIARSLMHRPKLIILDEPTVGLDPQIRRALWDMIEELKRAGVTIVLTTHYLDEAEKLSDRVCMLDQGRIRLVETPDKLLADFNKKNLEDVFLELHEKNF